ncbi:MAG: tRNA (adenosine(37)-N6)-dimethylallyltransferase MiaA [Clostridiales bacterium]|nr:tRNA (adenosine(37)-N6)-dimethylallyltransferase MiaA [Clostridiales bacterium]
MAKFIAAVVGPTASGKTALSIELAERLGGEIISCDSMQIYRGMDIGTAKPTVDEMRGIPHHMIDIIEPSERFSAADYAPLARAAADDIIARGKLPIFCGGTGLYLDAVLTANVYSPGETDETLRSELLQYAGQNSVDALWQRLNAVDPETAEAVHPNNVKRVARALEIYLTTGTPKSEWDRRSRLAPPPYQSVLFALDRPRDELYERIDSRVDIMLEAGLVDEVRGLVDSGRLPRVSTAAQAIGYKEIISFLDGETTLDAAVDEIKRSSRRYAKRQLTWFRREKSVNWLNMDNNFEVIVNNALKLLTFD